MGGREPSRVVRRYRARLVAAGGDLPEYVGQSANFPSATLVGHRVVLNGSLRRDSGGKQTAFCVLDSVKNEWCWYEVEGPSVTGHCAWLLEDKIYLYGGYHVGHNSGGRDQLEETTIWTLDLLLEEFSQVKTFGKSPGSRRENSSGHYLQRQGQFLVFGGLRRADTFSNELFLLDIARSRWKQPSVTGKLPQARFQHGSLVVGNTMFVYGGWGRGTRVRGGMHLLTWNWDCSRLRWSQLRLESPDFTISSFVFARCGAAFVFFGGYSDEKRSLLTVFEPSTAKFHSLSVFNTQGLYKLELEDRVPHTGCQTGVQIGKKLLIFGGQAIRQWRYIELTADLQETSS